MSDNELREITPQAVSDTIDVVLLVTAPDREAMPFIMAFTDSATMGSAEAQARQRLGTGSTKAGADYQRYAGMVRVKIPRDLLVERWTRADA